jgi:hypothetical protein
MPRLYFVRMTYLARVRLDRIRARWRTRWRGALRAVRSPRAVDAQAATAESRVAPRAPQAPAGLAETIAMAAAGRARLEVSTVGVTLRTAPAMQRWVALERTAADRPPTVAVIVQGPARDAAVPSDG